jgi:DNA-binding NarL/FixJ family response regulator
MLLDVHIPGDGIAAARIIASNTPNVKIIMLTGSCDDDHVSAALNAGAHGYLLKGATVREVQDSVRAVHSGRPYVTQELASRLLVQNVGLAYAFGKNNGVLSKLTFREQQVAIRVTAGHTNKKIAEELDLPIRTIRECLSTILQKCGVSSRIEAAITLDNRFDKFRH